MKTFAYCTGKGATDGWSAIGYKGNKKATFQLKHPEKGTLTLSEKDIRPIIHLLEYLQANLKEECNAKTGPA